MVYLDSLNIRVFSKLDVGDNFKVVDPAAKGALISLRTMIKAADLRKAFPAGWQNIAKTTLMRRV